MTTFADQVFCNTDSQFCNTCTFKRKNGTPKEAGTSQNGKFCARAIRQEHHKKTENPLARYFTVALSKIKRKPSSVSCEFASVMVLDALATRGARPPVATTGAV